jgi:hypothetical protein
VSSQSPDQPALPFEPPLERSGDLRENPADELSFDRFATALLQEVVRRSAAMDVRDVQRGRRKPRHAA